MFIVKGLQATLFFLGLQATHRGYCHIHNRINDFKELFNPLFINKDMILEDMRLNNIREIEDFIVRIAIILDNSNRKTIR